MNKQEFLARLGEGLSGLPRAEAEERLAFYNEMVDDRMEEGLGEEDAVAAIGPVEELTAQILAETPLALLVKERMKPKRRLRGWELTLLVLGFPLWLPLLIAAFAVLLSLYIVIWAVIVSLWAVEVSFIAGAVGGAAAGVWLLCRGQGSQGLVFLAGALLLAGLAVFLFFGCRAATRGAGALTKKLALRVKSLFLRKEKEA